MKHLKKTFLTLITLSIIFISCNDDDDSSESFLPPAESAINKIISAGSVQHIVLFSFKASVTNPEINNIINRFTDLKNSKRNGETYINSIEYGFQNSNEGVDGGFEIAFIVNFENEDDRDYYVGKPFLTEEGTFDENHDAFKSFVGPFLKEVNGVLVFDYNLLF